jgi:hypothetical protein
MVGKVFDCSWHRDKKPVHILAMNPSEFTAKDISNLSVCNRCQQTFSTTGTAAQSAYVSAVQTEEEEK